MKELTYEEKINDALNMTLSLNYMVLNANKHATPEGKMYFDRNDIFNKSRQQRIRDEELKLLADGRMQCLVHISDFINSPKHLEMFRENNLNLVNYYNKVTGAKLKTSDIFTSNDIKDINKIFDMAETVQESQVSEFSKFEFLFVVTTYLEFYNTYKNWLMTKELFDVVKEDVTPYGAKSFSYGKPENPEVLCVDVNYLQNVLDVYFDFINKKIKQMQKKTDKTMKNIKDLDDENLNLQNLKTFENSQNIENLAEYCKVLSDRIDAAQRMPEKKETILDKIITFIIHQFEQPSTFEIKNIYVHQDELLRLISTAATFPELLDTSIDLTRKYMGEEYVKEIYETLNQDAQEKI